MAAAPRPLSNTILVLPVPSLSRYSHLEPLIVHATTKTKNRLLIVLYSRLFDPEGGINYIQSWHNMEKLLSFIYTRASRVAMELNRVLMRIDVLLYAGRSVVVSDIERERSVKWDAVFAPANVDIELLPQWIGNFPRSSFLDHDVSAETSDESFPSSDNAKLSRHPVVALGGTFDHLHAGHKILLSMAAWIADRKVIVGVSDDALLERKANRHVMETIEQRMIGVREFLSLFRPDIELDVVPISDVYGPTGYDEDIQALVLSKETMSGAKAIAKHRAEKSLPALETFVIDVISGQESLENEEDAEKLKTAKMSSTFIREWISKNIAKDRT